MTRAVSMALVIVVLASSPTHGQRAGEVTHRVGLVTVRRPGPAAPTFPLYLKDDLFLGDRIAIGEGSLVSLLLARKANVTLRERSSIAIDETHAINLLVGKLALLTDNVAFAIHTPNAIVSMIAAGEAIVIVQVSPADDPRGPCPSISEFAVLRGMASVVAMNWSTRQAGIPVSVGPSNSIKIPGCGPRSDPRTLTPAEVEAWKAGLGRLKYAPQ